MRKLSFDVCKSIIFLKLFLVTKTVTQQYKRTFQKKRDIYKVPLYVTGVGCLLEVSILNDVI